MGIQAARKKRDECGITVSFDLDGEAIGTIRIVPLGQQLTLTEALMNQMGPHAPAIAPGDWEVGRLILAEAYRSDVDALRHCLCLALDYAIEHARIERLHATCTHVLSRLYRRFGFGVVAREVPLSGTAKTYSLIRGTSTDVAIALGTVRLPARLQ